MIASVLAVAVIIFFAEKRRNVSSVTSKGEGDLFVVTGYCNCGKCCSWRYRWFFFGEPVYTYGKLKGKPKKVGVTSSGKKARHGTVAADLNVFPYGTKLNIPGYGQGIVEDIGGAIKGRHIDIWFPTHTQARMWGKRYLKITKIEK